MRIAIAGGTGLLGRLAVGDAQRRGHEVVVLSRSRGVDLVSGHGVSDALAGVEAVVDVSNVSTLKATESVAFFERATRTLLAAGRDAGVRAHVVLSIVGVDAAPYDYYAGKVAQERLVAASDLPWTILRATQFHEFAMQVYDSAAAGPVHAAPRMRTQPIAAREVAARLLDLAEGPAQGRVADLAGPREESLVDLVRRYARASGRGGLVVGLPLPGPFGRAQRDGSLLPGPGADRGTETFAEWLTRATSAATAS